MKACAAVLLWSAITALGVEVAPAPAAAPMSLRWLNGETLSGDWLEASPNELTWKSPLFEEPLVLRWDVLRRIDCVVPAGKNADAFSVILRDGSHLYGELQSLNEEIIFLRSSRHGEVALKRAEVASLRRLRGENLVAAGPNGEVGWDLLANRKTAGASPGARSLEERMRILQVARVGPASSATSATAIKTGLAGALELPYSGGGAFLDLALPELVDAEFRVKSSARPSFNLSLEAGAKQRLRIETWDRELVLVCGENFKAIRLLGEDEREVALRICWDRKARRCAVFTPAGELLTDWNLPEDIGISGASVVLLNKGRDLSLEFLRVRKWNGKPPASIDLKKPRIELTDGRILQGTITGIATESLKFQGSNAEPEMSFPLEEVEALVLGDGGNDGASGKTLSDVEAFFFANPRSGGKGARTTLSYADGTLLFGQLESLKEGRISLATSFTAEPLTASIEGLRQCLNGAASPDGLTPLLPLADLDQMVVQGKTFRGRVVNTGNAAPQWLAVGAVRPVAPSLSVNSEITQTPSSAGEVEPTAVLIYLNSGDVLSGKLRSLDRTMLEVESELFETRKLPVSEVNALQFGFAGQVSLKGFAGEGWRTLKGDGKAVIREADSLTMQPGTSVGHASAMQSTEFQFTMLNRSSPTVRLRLFCNGLEEATGLALLVANWGSRVYFGLEATPGQFETQNQVAIPSGKPLKVRLAILEKEIELFLNDVSVGRFPIAASKRGGTGLILEPSSLWGNTVYPITLTEFSSRYLPGAVALPEVTTETRTQALTIPRFRKNDLPRHALLAANGDVLRGEIEAATATHFGFRSGLENLQVPRERVKAVIWLKKPAAGSAIAAPPSPEVTRLQQKIKQRMRYSAATLSTLTTLLEREVSGLKFKLPEVPDTRRFPMQFVGQSVADALDQIGKLFGLEYRVEGGTTVIFAPSSFAATELVQKFYWMKSEAIPADRPVQTLLEEKGISFAKGASATWQPESRHLMMSNTPENHRKLAGLIDSDFGGSLGSPTHWLQLTNGARLSILAEKFDRDAVHGRNPVYGRCKVPVAMIHTIRTAPPAATAAIRAVKDWQLTFAPEPVLPETGGESSPLLGKAAASFKLPLLAGGEFELGKEKGKVVVLEFWATWCGPCIKAVPALTEALAAFPDERVKLIGVNQSEPGEQVKRFIETRGWKLTVAMDAGQNVAKQFGVDGIPHTVIVGPDGKVAWVKSGASSDTAAEVVKAVQELLAPAPAVQ